MNEHELRECPFCGAGAMAVECARPNHGWLMVACRGCGVETPRLPGRAAIAAWNARATDQGRDAAVGTLRIIVECTHVRRPLSREALRGLARTALHALGAQEEEQ